MAFSFPGLLVEHRERGATIEHHHAGGEQRLELGLGDVVVQVRAHVPPSQAMQPREGDQRIRVGREHVRPALPVPRVAPRPVAADGAWGRN